ncbi:MAG TPA: 3-oxoacyl-[acyl-carrier-protein] synthase III C-terminal domain-containing protein [Conexibacter sp.]|nr:3-oxoacyl-[acyl-carrier-protein] synthase III C-terminal domain-containing protein [Conexibacter sp.]
MNVRVNEISVANPATSYTQEQMLELLGLADDPFAQMIFARCGVEQRHHELTPEMVEMTLQQRTTQTEEQLLRMSTEAVDQLELDPALIGTVITATYYSLGGPTLAHKLVEHYGMDPTTDKYHVIGVGCASAVPLFKLASQSMRDHPGKHALVVAADTITGFLTTVDADDEQVKTIGSSLFGDGCAAAVLTNGASVAGPSIVASRQHQIEGTLETVLLRVGGDDSFMHIGRELPKLARRQLRELVSGFLADAAVDAEEIDHWIVHPGGRGIIDGVQHGLGLTDEDVAISRDVLARFGNMGTPSSFYVLRETIARRAPQPGERGLVVTIGPGVTVGLMLLSW